MSVHRCPSHPIVSAELRIAITRVIQRCSTAADDVPDLVQATLVRALEIAAHGERAPRDPDEWIPLAKKIAHDQAASGLRRKSVRSGWTAGPSIDVDEVTVEPKARVTQPQEMVGDRSVTRPGSG